MTEAGKEQRLLDHILGLPKEKLNSIRGNPAKVLEVIDEYNDNVEWFMSIGPIKGKVIVEKIRETKPQIMIELGGYVGYSAILFASTMGDLGKYYTFEASEEYATIARKIIDLAGLSLKVEIFVGKAGRTLPEFEEKLALGKRGHARIDFVFIDHDKGLYLPDLRVLESLGMIAPGTTIVADNIYYADVPEYVAYIKSSPEEKREHNYDIVNISGKEFPGRWNILYETKTIEVRELQDAMEISKCIEYLDG